MSNTEVILTILVALATAFSTFATYRATRRKIDAEGSEVYTRTALSLIEPLKSRLKELEARVTHLEKENRALRAWGLANEELVRTHGGIPASLEHFMEAVQ